MFALARSALSIRGSYKNLNPLLSDYEIHKCSPTPTQHQPQGTFLLVWLPFGKTKLELQRCDQL